MTAILCNTLCPCLSPLRQILGTLGVLATFFWLLFTPMDYNLSAQQQLQLQKKRLGGWSCDVQCDCHVTCRVTIVVLFVS